MRAMWNKPLPAIAFALMAFLWTFNVSAGPAQSLDAARAAFARDPQNAWAHALSGGWNLEIVRDGGMLGETLYGASLDKGVDAYERALTLEPGNPAIVYQYALQLIAFGTAPRRSEAKRVLATARYAEPRDALERLAHRRAQRLKLALDTHDETALKLILRDRLGDRAGGDPPLPQNLPRPGGGRGPATGSPR